MDPNRPGLIRVLNTVVEGFRATFLAWSPPPSPVFTRVRPHRFPRLASWLRSDNSFWLGALGVFAIGVAAGQEWPGAIGLVVGVLAVTPVILARHNLLLGWRAAVVISIVAALNRSQVSGGGMTAIVVVGLALFTFSIAISFARPIGLWAWGVTVPIIAVILGTPLSVTAIFGGLLALVTDGLWTRRRATRDLSEERERTAAERILRVTAEDRARMARDFHDVVAHHMSMVAVRAETAPYRIDGLSEEAKSEFAEISLAARESLDEMRGVLSLLRGGDAPRVPQPDLSQVDDLIDGANRAGADVEMQVSGRRRQLRPALELSAYRILQESLSNVTRHAAGEKAVVSLHYGEDNLTLTIVNVATEPAGSHGHGIVGMRERAKAVGGHVEAHLRDDDRFVVEAVLPVEP